MNRPPQFIHDAREIADALHAEGRCQRLAVRVFVAIRDSRGLTTVEAMILREHALNLYRSEGGRGQA